jgi:spermidine synthase
MRDRPGTSGAGSPVRSAKAAAATLTPPSVHARRPPGRALSSATAGRRRLRQLDGHRSRAAPVAPERSHRPRFAAATALLLFALAAAVAGNAPAAAERPVHREVSRWQTIVVTESPTRRCLRFGDGADHYNQSCQIPARPSHLVFDYTRAMVSTLLLWNPPPARVLLIGVGGGSIPMALAAARPDMTIDAVDIDEAVLRVAERFFGLRPGLRLRLRAADGRDYVAAARARGEQFDAVLLDAFDAEGIPPALFSEAFLRDIRALLSAGGVFLANTFSASPSSAHESAAARSVFGRAYSVRPGRNAANRLIVAAASPDRLPSPEALLAAVPAQRAALARVGIDDRSVQRLSFTQLVADR